MEDHNSDHRSDDDETSEEVTFTNLTPLETDALLVELVKGYPHLYDKQSRDFKDITKRNNSWVEIGRVLNTTAESCQSRWVRLRERYSREKKLQGTKTKDNTGTSRSSFALYDQMNFLHKFVKSRRSSVYKRSQLDGKQIILNEINSNKTTHLISTGQVFNQSNITDKKTTDKNTNNLSKNKLESRVTPISIVPAYISSSMLPTPTLALSSFQILPIKSTDCSIAPSLEISKNNNNNLGASNVSKKVSGGDEHLLLPQSKMVCMKKLSSSDIKNEVIATDVHSVPSDRDTSSPAVSVASSLGKSMEKTICTNQAENRIEESLLKLTTMMEQYLENKNKILQYNNSMDEEDLFAKTIADQLRKISEPEKTTIKGQIMKVLYNH